MRQSAQRTSQQALRTLLATSTHIHSVLPQLGLSQPVVLFVLTYVFSTAMAYPQAILLSKRNS